MKKKDIIQQYKNLSFSEAAEAIGKKWKNKDTDLIEKNSYNQELQALADFQEKKKVVAQMQDAIKQFKCGGKLPQHAYGGLLGEPDPNAAIPLADPLFGGNYLPPLQLPNTNYGTRPETILGYAKTSITPGVAVQPFDDTAFGMPQVPEGGFKVGVDESNVSTQPRTTGEMSAYTPALIGQGLSTVLNAGILAGGYDKVAPVDNPYESQVKNLLTSRGIDTTQQRNQILSAYNAAKDNLSNTRSANVNTALNANLLNVTQDNLAESKLQEQEINNQYVGEYANVLQGLGQQKANTQVYAEDMTARNKGAWQSNLSSFGASAADNSEFFTTQKLNTIQNKLLSDILDQRYADVGLNKDIANRLSSGKTTPEDIVVLKKAYGENAANSLIEAFKLK